MGLRIKTAAALAGVAGGMVLLAGPAGAWECTNADKPAGAGAQVIFGGDDGVIFATKGLENRIDRGIIDPETGEGYHGIVAWDEDGDGVADGHTFVGIGPEGEIPLSAQLNGSPDHGIVNLCGPQGCN